MIRKTEAGQALPLTAAALIALLAVMGLSIDLGVMRYDKRLQQTAADAAAIAGAQNLAAGGAVTAGAQNASSMNGYTDNTGSSKCTTDPSAIGCIKVTINNPPLSGPHRCAADPSDCSKYVEAYVTDVQPTYFMKILGVDSEAVVARAVATNVGSGFGDAGGGGCIVTTGLPTKQLNANNAGFGTSGSVILNAPTCGIVDNGNLTANGGTNLSINAGTIGVGGTYSAPSQEDCSASPPVGVCPQPCADGTVCNMPYTGDPLSNTYGKLTLPSTTPSSGPVDITSSGCSGTGCSGVTCTAVTTTSSTGTKTTNQDCSITPGIYDYICVQAQQLLNFSDGGSTSGGLFVIAGDIKPACATGEDFKVAGGATICNSTKANCSGLPGTANSGVTFYLAGTTESAHVSGKATVELSAPNSGTYEGMLFWQAPDNPSTMTLLGNSNSYYQGAIYAADTSSQLYFGGNTGFNGEAAYTLIDVGQLTLAGNPDITLNSDYSGLAGGGGPLTPMISIAVLVE